jgi:hypothetical protein
MVALPSQTLKKLRVGSDVEFDMGTFLGRGTVVEDRGVLGPHGQRVWRVSVKLTDADVETFEIPESKIRRVR